MGGADVEGAKAEIASRAKQKADEQEMRVFKRSVDILSGRFPLATKEEVEEALRESQNKTAFAMKMLGKKYPKAPPSPFSTGRAPIRKKKSNEKAVSEESPTDESSQKDADTEEPKAVLISEAKVTECVTLIDGDHDGNITMHELIKFLTVL